MNATTLSCNSGAPAAPQDPPPVTPETCRKCLGTGKDFDAEFGVHTCLYCGGTGRAVHKVGRKVQIKFQVGGSRSRPDDPIDPNGVWVGGALIDHASEDDDDLIAVGASMHRRIDVERWCS